MRGMHLIGRVARIGLVLLLIVTVAYFGYIGVEASHRLVNQHYRNPDCRTPAQLGIEYEAINYDIATDEDLAAREPDMTECSAPGAPVGEDLVSSDGVRLAGWYVPAASGIGPEGPTVVVSHGWTSNKSGVVKTLSVLHDDYNVVLFDFRNHGQSAASQTTQGINEQRDLDAVIDWLAETKGPDVIALWGQSMGGHTAVNVAADDERVDAVILDATHSRLTVPMANRIELDGYPFGQVGALAGVLGAWARTGVNVMSDDPIDAVDELGDRPLLIVHAGADDTIPLSDAERLRDAAAAGGVDVRLESCADASHTDTIETCTDDYERWVDDLMQQGGAR